MSAWPQWSMGIWLALVVCSGAGTLLLPSRGEWIVLTPSMQRKAAIGFLIGGILEAVTLFMGSFWS